jgi:hypothetical protein
MEPVLIAANVSWTLEDQGLITGWLVGPLLVRSFGIKDLALDKRLVFER